MIWTRVFFPVSLIRLKGVRAAGSVGDAVNTSGKQRFPLARGKRLSACLLIVRNVGADIICRRNAANALQSPIRRETVSRDTHQLSLWTERQGIPVVSGNDSSVLKTQVPHSPVRMSEHRRAIMTQIRIRFRRRTNFHEDVSSIFQLDSMRAPDTRSVEQVAAELATQMRLAKLIHHPRNQYGTVGSEAVQLDGRRFPSIKILLDCCSGVVDDSHFATLLQ